MSNNRIERLWQHWCLPSWRIKKWFPQTTLTRLERAIGESEAQHMGQIRFVIESNMETMAVLQGVTPRQRARQYFGSLEAALQQMTAVLINYIPRGEGQAATDHLSNEIVLR